MEIRIKDNAVEIEGYVNAVERASKPLWSRMGQFIERICKGAFGKALKRADDVRILLNHDEKRDLGGIKDGNLELDEDAIGLHAKATITDADVVKKARNGELVGWSFGFFDKDVDVKYEDGLPLRMVKDLDLLEVSLLDRTKTPAYDGTLVAVRADEKNVYFGEQFEDEINIRELTEETAEEKAEETVEETVKDEPEQETVRAIDYSEWETLIEDMKKEEK